MSPLPRTIASTVALAVCLAAPLQADLLVVHGSGTADYLTIAAAVSAAVDGDTIIVRGGHYGPFPVSKELQILAEPGAEVTIMGTPVISNLAAGAVLRLVGCELTGYLRVDGNTGTVVIQQCLFDPYFFDGPSLCIEDSGDVVLIDCHLDGGQGGAAGVGHAGIDVRRSSVALYGCDVKSRQLCGETSGPGARIEDSFAYFSGCVVRGAQGWISHCDYGPGDGGDGLVATGASQVIAVNTQFIAGLGGYEAGAFCGNEWGEAGVPTVLVPPATLEVLPAAGRQLFLPRAVLQSSDVPLVALGEPGDSVILLEGPLRTFRYRPSLSGVEHLDPAGVTTTGLGTIGANGRLETTLLAPVLPPGLRELEAAFQVAVIDALGVPVLGSPAELVVVDELPGYLCYPVIHVDADAPPGGDGASWATAFDDLQDAVSRVAAGLPDCPPGHVELWIAEGTYDPAGGTQDPGLSFVLLPGMELYGGFDGTETSRRERDPAAHPTILSGDLGGQTNTATLVEVPEPADPDPRPVVIDGLTVREAGYGGGGIWIQGRSTIEVRGCRIEDNEGFAGGGLHALEARGLIVDTLFLGNRALNQGGGAWINTDIAVYGCTFAQNVAQSNGTQDAVGGGLYFRPGLGPGVVACCKFVGNEADRTGALHVGNGDERMAVTSCTFVANRATSGTGGLAAVGSDVHVFNDILWRNSVNGVQDEAAQVDLPPPAQATIGYCLVQGWSGVLGGVANVGHDPRFVDIDGADGVLGTLDDDLRLRYESPAIDAARNAALPKDVPDLDGDGDVDELLPLDLAGRSRFTDMILILDLGIGPGAVSDIGAYERVSPQLP